MTPTRAIARSDYPVCSRMDTWIPGYPFATRDGRLTDENDGAVLRIEPAD